MIAYLNSIAVEVGSAKVTLTTTDLASIPALMALMGEKLDVHMVAAQMRLPLDEAATVANDHWNRQA